MTTHHRRASLILLLAGTAWAAPALAQGQGAPATGSSGGNELIALGKGELRGELLRRHDAGVAMTQDAAVVGANDTRYIWASEAKAQCGIALGWLKDGTRDPVSIGKCADAWARMQQQPVAPMVLTPPTCTVTAEVCRQPIAGTVFFEFDSAVPPGDASQTIAFIANNIRPCGWAGLVVTGHADRSGGDQYNDALSMRRANAVAGLLAGAGVGSGLLTVSGRGEAEPRVPTPDGERNPTNRRVEITVK